MLVHADNGGPPGRPLGLLDSPTLARVERAMLRHEEGANRDGAHCYRMAQTQSLLSANFGKESVHAIKRGLLWQQRDKLFSRWKERYFILTRDYLHCFRRASGADRISEMGQFLFKVKLIDVEQIQWENKKTYSTVALVLGRDGKILLRAPEGLEDWFELLEECMLTSKERRRALRHSHDSKSRENNNINTSLDEWLAARQKLPMGRRPTDSISVRQDPVKRREWLPREEDWENPTYDNRLSRQFYPAKINSSKQWRSRLHFFTKPRSTMLTDIDINTYDDSTLEAPSITSYRLNQDVLCVQPPSLRAAGSFRSTRESTSSTKRNAANIQDAHCQFMKFRERSYSDIQRVDKRPWRALGIDSRKFN